MAKKGALCKTKIFLVRNPNTIIIVTGIESDIETADEDYDTENNQFYQK